MTVIFQNVSNLSPTHPRCSPVCPTSTRLRSNPLPESAYPDSASRTRFAGASGPDPLLVNPVRPSGSCCFGQLDDGGSKLVQVGTLVSTQAFLRGFRRVPSTRFGTRREACSRLGTLSRDGSTGTPETKRPADGRDHLPTLAARGLCLGYYLVWIREVRSSSDFYSSAFG
jgi:hypothetical protein